MIKHDLHIHSLQSLCGIHSLMEIVNIAGDKGLTTVNISDHGSANGKVMVPGVITDKRRVPPYIKSSAGTEIRVLSGIEANILNIDGDSDFPMSYKENFDLVSAGFHDMARDLQTSKSPDRNLEALNNFLQRYPLDILTHPNIIPFPLPVTQLIDLSLKYGFALEINNTNLNLNKTNLKLELQMIREAIEKGARLVENSDGHTFIEIGENRHILEFLKKRHIDDTKLFLNRNDDKFESFLEERKALRTKD